MGFKSRVEGEKAGEVLVELSLAGASPTSGTPTGSSTSSGSQPAASSPYPTPPSPASSSGSASSKGKEQSEAAPIFILTLLSRQTPDNRLTPQLLTATLAALEHLSDLWESSLLPAQPSPPAAPIGAALVITGTTSGATSKFFSNGLDFESAITTMGFFDLYLFPVYEKLMTFPIPVVASIGGHCFAAGWGLMAACDYAVMGGKGFMSMNEIDFGAQIPPGLFAPLSKRIAPSPSLRNRVVLQGERFPGAEALKCGFIDEHLPQAGPKEVLDRAVELGRKWASKSGRGVWGENKVSDSVALSNDGSVALEPRLTTQVLVPLLLVAHHVHRPARGTTHKVRSYTQQALSRDYSGDSRSRALACRCNLSLPQCSILFSVYLMPYLTLSVPERR
ncbi:ClpP/crotonase [Microstroma glucosiphilum]|uniref:ClpP/crotonase n=1 Tax=Pseudomicrostroma glucosiphilum TaxID=1684307 RepID=A0A316UFT7_9BASI|nr:ClpP/crotonase [Pseudomicrostroma glucosiphilum]PWN24116.1 ClpP/crotonase [Pseudomicrostroma glucosiphilum]